MSNMNVCITAALLGAGIRGLEIYGNYALKIPNKLKFIAVAEPEEGRRNKFAKLHNIPKNRCYKSWEDLLSGAKLADIVFICTQDQLHTKPTLIALEKGYDVVLEKPMAHNLKECVEIVKKAEETGRKLWVCHVLRYTDFFATIVKIIKKGLLGTLINITHRENISGYHMVHSFVRGNWSNEETSSSLILAKCCHDLDLLYWMVKSLPKKLNSFGNLLHFRMENAPKDAPQYCLDNCPIEEKCLYYAPRIYVDIVPITQIMQKSENKFLKTLGWIRQKHKKILSLLSKIIPPLKRLRFWQDWPVIPLYYSRKENFTDDAKKEILKNSPYGKCVYYCNNNVVDHQTVNIEFENGVTANLIVHGFSPYDGRSLRIDGTNATLIGNFYDYGEKIVLHDHYSGKKKLVFKKKLKIGAGEHGGGDRELMNEIVKSYSNKVDKVEIKPLTSAKESLESHLMAFAAEESRKKGTVVDMEEYRKKAYMA